MLFPEGFDILSLNIKGALIMKNRKLIFIILIILIVCLSVSVFLLRPKAPKAQAVIMHYGTIVRTVDLSKDETFIIDAIDGGYNQIQIKDGYISVIEASCPDHICMAFGWCNSGMPIVCLPNDLIIEFPTGETYDGISG